MDAIYIAIGIGLFAAFVGLLVLMDRAMPRLLPITLEDDGIAFRFFRRWCIRYDDIVGVEVLTPLAVLFDTSLNSFKRLNVGNRIFARRAVVVSRRNGWVVVLTVSDPEAFARALTPRCPAVGAFPAADGRGLTRA